jgi:hypothetical protein
MKCKFYSQITNPSRPRWSTNEEIKKQLSLQSYEYPFNHPIKQASNQSSNQQTNKRSNQLTKRLTNEWTYQKPINPPTLYLNSQSTSQTRHTASHSPVTLYMIFNVLTGLYLGVSPFITLYIALIAPVLHIFLCVLLSLLSLNLHVHTPVCSSQLLQDFSPPLKHFCILAFITLDCSCVLLVKVKQMTCWFRMQELRYCRLQSMRNLSGWLAGWTLRWTHARRFIVTCYLQKVNKMKEEWGDNVWPPVTSFETHERILIKFSILVPAFRVVVRNEFWLMLDVIRRRDPQVELRRTVPRTAQLREIV